MLEGAVNLYVFEHNDVNSASWKTQLFPKRLWSKSQTLHVPAQTVDVWTYSTLPMSHMLLKTVLIWNILRWAQVWTIKPKIMKTGHNYVKNVQNSHLITKLNGFICEYIWQKKVFQKKNGNVEDNEHKKSKSQQHFFIIRLHLKHTEENTSLSWKTGSKKAIFMSKMCKMFSIETNFHFILKRNGFILGKGRFYLRKWLKSMATFSKSDAEIFQINRFPKESESVLNVPEAALHIWTESTPNNFPKWKSIALPEHFCSERRKAAANTDLNHSLKLQYICLSKPLTLDHPGQMFLR